MEKQASTVVLDERGVANTVSIHRITHVPARQTVQRHDKTTHKAKKLNGKAHKSKWANPISHKAKNTGEYVVEKINRHVGQGPNIRRIVRLYKYGPTKDTVASRPYFTTLF